MSPVGKRHAESIPKEVVVAVESKDVAKVETPKAVSVEATARRRRGETSSRAVAVAESADAGRRRSQSARTRDEEIRKFRENAQVRRLDDAGLFQAQKEARKLLLSTKVWLELSKDAQTTKQRLNEHQKEIAAITTSLFAHAATKEIGKHLVDAIKGMLLNGHKCVQRPCAENSVSLDQSLQAVLQAVRKYLQARSSLVLAAKNDDIPRVSPSPPGTATAAAIPAAPTPVPAPYVPITISKIDLNSLKHLLALFEDASFRGTIFRSESAKDAVSLLVESMQNEISGIAKKSHPLPNGGGGGGGGKTVDNCFPAKDVVIWLVKNHFACDALQAAKIFHAATNDGFLVEVVRDPAKLSASFYRFGHDEKKPREVATDAAPLSPRDRLLSPFMKRAGQQRKAHLASPCPPIPGWIEPATELLKAFSWDPIICDKCAAVCASLKSRMCPVCKAHYFRNPVSGKPLRLMINVVPGFSYELGTKPVCARMPGFGDELRMEDWSTDIPWYSKTFGTVHLLHSLYVADPSQRRALIVAVEMVSAPDALTGEWPAAKVLIMDDQGSRKAVVHGTEPREAKERLQLLKVLLPADTPDLHWVQDMHALANELIEFEKKMMFRNFKFGVLLLKPNQKTETEMYSNQEGSRHYEEFLSLLGTRVALAAHQGFRGGLDCRGTNSTGDFSVYTRLAFDDSGKLLRDQEGMAQVEVMFHVATLLPFDTSNVQQLHRKRHLGNDVVILVFREPGASQTLFDPSVFASQFNHIFVVVTPVKFDREDSNDPLAEVTHYRMQVCCKQGVKPFRPFLHESSSLFRKNDLFRYLVLMKLINAERAAMYAKDFALRMQRTRKDVLLSMQKTYFGGDE